MGGAEAVEEMQEGQGALYGGKVGHRRQVHDLLGIGGGKHGEAGAPAGHHVAVVAEDVQGVGGHGAGGDMDDAGELFPGDLEHVGDHEQQALGRGKGAGQGAGGQRAVHRAGCAGFRLHLHQLDLLAEYVFPAARGPAVRQLGHNGGRGDGIDGRHIGKSISHVRGGGVAIHGFQFPCQFRILLTVMFPCAFAQ